MNRAFIWKVIIAQLFLSVFIDKFFNSNICDSLLIAYTKNPQLGETMFLPNLDIFSQKFLIFLVIKAFISLGVGFLIWVSSYKEMLAGQGKIWFITFSCLFTFNAYSTVYDIIGYKNNSKLYLFSKGNFFFNQTLIKNAKDSGDYGFLNKVVYGTSMSDEDVIEIVKKRPREATLHLDQSVGFEITNPNKITECNLVSGPGSIEFDKESGSCKFINNDKKLGESSIVFKFVDETGPNTGKLLIYSL